MKKASRFVIIFLLLGGAAFGAWKVSSNKGAVAQAAARAAIRTVTARTDTIAVKVSETGSLEPVTQVEVKSRVAGRVQKIFVREGDIVQAGTLLALVDPTEVTREAERIKAQMDSSRAGLMQAEQNYTLTKRQNALAIARAEAGLKEAKARLVQTAAPTRSQDLGQAQVAVLRAEAQASDARRSLERKKNLVAKGFVAQAEADSAQVAVQLADADVASAKQRVSLLKEGTRREDIDTARASVATAEISLETEKANAAQAQLRMRDVERARAEVSQMENQLAQQNVQLKETRIVAPISGQIVGKFVEEGELVASATAGFAQGAALVKIADLTRMQVRVNVNEVDVARLSVGLPVEIRVDGVPDKTFGGKVAAIAPSSLGSNTTGSQSSNGTSVVRYEVKVAVTTPDKRLRPGMTAAVDILIRRKKNVVVLSAEALRDKNTVVVVTGKADQRKTETRTVTLGLKNDANVEIVSGLQAGDKVEVPKIEAGDRRKVSFDGPN